MTRPRQEEEAEERPRPTCPACNQLYDRPPPVLEHRDPARLYSPGDVRAATDRRGVDGLRHAAHRTGLRAWYELTTFVTCSFPDRTPHKRGFIVETLCGRLVNIGHVCGAQYIVGLGEVIRYANEMRDRARDLAMLRRSPDELGARVERLATELEGVARFRQRVDDKLPALAREMSGRVRSGAAGREVKVDVPATRDTRARFEVRSLTGLEAWRELSGDLRRSYQAMRSYIGSELARNPEPDAATVRKLAANFHQVRREADDAETFLSLARRFFSADNLVLALVAAKQREVLVDDDLGLVFLDQSGATWRKILPDGRMFNVAPPESIRRR